jgi:hypothetical protein
MAALVGTFGRIIGKRCVVCGLHSAHTRCGWPNLQTSSRCVWRRVRSARPGTSVRRPRPRAVVQTTLTQARAYRDGFGCRVFVLLLPVPTKSTGGWADCVGVSVLPLIRWHQLGMWTPGPHPRSLRARGGMKEHSSCPWRCLAPADVTVGSGVTTQMWIFLPSAAEVQSCYSCS